MKKSRNVLIYPFILIGLLFYLANSCNTDDTKDNDPVIEDTKVIDIDGNVYHTVTIGTQVWMVENLKTTKYRNGDPIPNVTDNKKWNDLLTGAYCNYSNETVIGNKYGRIYNGYAVKDSRNIAPTGWHIPSSSDWNALLSYVAAFPSSSASQAKDLAAKTDWAFSSTLGTVGNELTQNNATGFSALPGGSRVYNGSFNNIGQGGIWWGTDIGAMTIQNSKSSANYISFSYIDGNSVRCIKD